jgi:hypothetical protein
MPMTPSNPERQTDSDQDRVPLWGAIVMAGTIVAIGAFISVRFDHARVFGFGILPIVVLNDFLRQQFGITSKTRPALMRRIFVTEIVWMLLLCAWVLTHPWSHA